MESDVTKKVDEQEHAPYHEWSVTSSRNNRTLSTDDGFVDVELLPLADDLEIAVLSGRAKLA